MRGVLPDQVFAETPRKSSGGTSVRGSYDSAPSSLGKLLAPLRMTESEREPTAKFAVLRFRLPQFFAHPLPKSQNLTVHCHRESESLCCINVGVAKRSTAPFCVRLFALPRVKIFRTLQPSVDDMRQRRAPSRQRMIVEQEIVGAVIYKLPISIFSWR
jgi:hypothetical protein